MSYQVLARKWRPRSFQTMVGQESTLRILANALEQKRIHHAYLFTGTRGVGKTTVARIIAKCLNCETGITPTPCDQCTTCQAINAGHFLDLFEIDAASRTKVEDMRELLDNVMYPPTQGRYKIYLIDEVHMLSNHSFNALLKTLEEPPAQVIFLFATTDPKKIPVTILSRCLQFHLARITPEQISSHLQHICTAENITCDEHALHLLAKAADGSMRDALSLLDQAIAYGHGQVTRNEVETMLGSISQDSILPLIEALATHDAAATLAAVRQLTNHAPDFGQVLGEMISLFHQMAIAQIVPDAALENETARILSATFTPEDIQLYYQIALLGRRDLAYASSPQQGFEMIILRMLAFQPSHMTMTETPNIARLPAQAASSKAAQKTKVTTAATAVTEINDEWRDILPKLGLSGMAYALAANCTMESVTENTVELALSTSHQPMLNTKLKERLAEALTRHFNRPLQLTINVSPTVLATPIKQQQHDNDQRLEAAKQTAMQNPAIKQLIDMYDATVDVSLLT